MPTPLLGPIEALFSRPDLPGGLLYTYSSHTTNPLETYQDAAGTVLNTCPIVLDSDGQAVIFLKELPYTFLLTDAYGVVQKGYPIHDINPGVYKQELNELTVKYNFKNSEYLGAASNVSSIISDIGTLDSSLTNKADLVHTHVKADITDFPSSIGPAPEGSILTLLYSTTGVVIADAAIDCIGASSAILSEYNLIGKYFERTTTGFKCIKACNVNVVVDVLSDMTFVPAIKIYKNSTYYLDRNTFMDLAQNDYIHFRFAESYSGQAGLIITLAIFPKVLVLS